jgi:AraC family transcriptional regulator
LCVGLECNGLERYDNFECDFHHGRFRSSKPLAERRNVSAAVARRLTKYVEAHLDRALCNDELAAVADVPALTFHKRFKFTFGLSPHRYVMRRRLVSACGLLRDATTSLADAAAAAGLCDQSHMTRLFKAHLGVTPGRWRRGALA